MPFIKFENIRIRSYEPVVSIYKNYVIAFNHIVVKKYGLDKFNYVTLYFNPDTSEIGIKFLAKQDVYSYKLHVDRKYISIGCKSFLQQYNILRPQKMIKDIIMGDIDMLIIKVEIKKEPG